MKQPASICLLIVLLSSCPALAQPDTAYRNSIKLNMLGMAFHNVSLLYERELNENWAVQLGSAFRWGGDLPRALALGDVIIGS